MGVCVGVSVGEGVSVGRGVEVSVNVGTEVKVSVKEMLVDVEAGSREGEAGASPELHASVASISDVIKRKALFFMFLIVPNPS